jgi:dihydroflavonol-4-reductase
MNYMLAVVTGGSGFLGGNLAMELLRQGHRVRATYRSVARTTHLRSFPIEWVQVDLNNQMLLRSILRNADVAFHCAGMVSLRDTPTLVKSNVEAVYNLIEAARTTGLSRLVHCSTAATIGTSKDGHACTEENACVKSVVVSGYTRTKLQAEELILTAAARDVHAVIVNPSHMLGPYAPRFGSVHIVVAIARGIVPRGLHRTTNFVDVRDVARGMVLAWQIGVRGERYILGGENLHYMDAIDRIAQIAGVPSPADSIKGQQILRDIERESVDFMYSSDKAKRELGYAPGLITSAVFDALKWFRLSYPRILEPSDRHFA